MQFLARGRFFHRELKRFVAPGELVSLSDTQAREFLHAGLVSPGGAVSPPPIKAAPRRQYQRKDMVPEPDLVTVLEAPAIPEEPKAAPDETCE